MVGNFEDYAELAERVQTLIESQNIDGADAELRKFRTNREGGTKLRKLGSLLEPAFELSRKRRNGDEQPVPLPFKEYAECIGGGYWPGLHILVGGTGAGKTQFSLGSALYASMQGIPVAYVGLELDEASIAMRAVSEYCNIAWSRLYLGRVSEPELEKARTVSETLANIPFYAEFGPPMGYPVTELLNLAVRLREAHPTGPLLIVLDYLQLIGEDPASNRKQELRERIGSAVYLARSLARDLGIAILVVSSAGRNSYRLLSSDAAEAGLTTQKVAGQFEPVKTIRNADELVGLGKESGEIEFAADTVTTLIRWPGQLDNGSRAVIAAVPKVRAGFPRWCALEFGQGRYRELPVNGIEDLPEAPKKQTRPKVKDEQLQERLLNTIRKGRYKTKTKVVAATEGTRKALFEELAMLMEDGLVVAQPDGILTVADEQ